MYLLDFRRSTERRSTDFRLLARLIVRLLSVFALRHLLPSAAGGLEGDGALRVAAALGDVRVRPLDGGGEVHDVVAVEDAPRPVARDSHGDPAGTAHPGTHPRVD